MAIGLGVAFGFSLPRNFRRPMLRPRSPSSGDWHISLSSWFRDYLYIPLGGNRGPDWKTWRNLIVVFLLCGLWHGAAWTFVLWGAWHGVFLSLERAGLGPRARPSPTARRVALCPPGRRLGWVLFRSADLGRTLDLWAGMTGAHGIGGLTPTTAMALTRQQLWLAPLAAVWQSFGYCALALALARSSGDSPRWSDNVAMGGLAGLRL